MWVKKVKTAVTDFLTGLSIPYKVLPHNREVFTSEDAAEQRGVRLPQIVKTLLLTGQDGSVIVAVLPGHKRIELKKIKKTSGCGKLHFMEREAIEQKFGLRVGALAPIGPALQNLPVFIDPSVFEEKQITFSSGDPAAGIEMNSEDLRKLLEHATVTEITKPE